MCAALQPLGGVEWPEPANLWFQDRVFEKSFFAIELDYTPDASSISLLDTSGAETVDVRDAVKDAGFATFEV